MKNTKWFLLVLLAVFSVCAVLLVWVVINRIGVPGNNASSDADPSTQSGLLSLNHFRPIQGTSIFIATLEQDAGWTPYVSARWFSFDYGYTVRNMVFLDGNTLSSHTLFASNDNYIINTHQFPISGFNNDPVQVKWLVYEIAQQDTNSDNVVNGEDWFSIAMSDVSGQNYVELLKSVQVIRGMDLIADSNLLLVYQSGDVFLVSKIDLEQQTVLETQPLTQLPLETNP